MKYFLAIFFIFAVVSATPRDLCTKNDDHRLVRQLEGKTCTTTVMDRSVMVEATTSPYPKENIKTIYIPESGTLTDKISFIQVINTMSNEDDGGCPNLIGSVGDQHVILELRSQKGKDMKFHVVVCTDK